MFPREPETTSNNIKRHQTTSNDIPFDIKQHTFRHSRLFHTSEWETIFYGIIIRNIDPSFWFRPLGIGTEYATHVYLPEVAGFLVQIHRIPHRG